MVRITEKHQDYDTLCNQEHYARVLCVSAGTGGNAFDWNISTAVEYDAESTLNTGIILCKGHQDTDIAGRERSGLLGATHTLIETFVDAVDLISFAKSVFRLDYDSGFEYQMRDYLKSIDRPVSFVSHYLSPTMKNPRFDITNGKALLSAENSLVYAELMVMSTKIGNDTQKAGCYLALENIGHRELLRR